MSTGLPGETGAVILQVAGAVIQADGQHARWDASKDNAAGSAEIVTGFVKTALLPFAVANRLGDYVREKLDMALTEQLRDVPPENIVPPLASVAGPALQGIGYSLDEDELRAMYEKLIATAMDGREPGKAHPSFANIIASLSKEETRYLALVLGGTHAIVEYRRAAKPEGYGVMGTNILPVVDLVTGEFVADPKLPQYVGNWAQLGLVDLDWTAHLSAPDAYEWIERHPQGAFFKMMFRDDFQSQNGIVRTTPFGNAFAAAVLPTTHDTTLGILTPAAQIPEPSMPTPVPEG